MGLVIIDTECANLSSVAFAFERMGVAPVISDDIDVITSAERLVLPGVGAAPYAMQKIKDKGLFAPLQAVRQPMLGICLGMQILFETLNEGGHTIDGLGLIPGAITRLDTQDLPSPHMGWNTLEFVKQDLLLNGVADGAYAYFVHSYSACVNDVTVAKTHYGNPFSAIVAYKNVYGCQFHPERSSQTGARILKNFLDIPA